MTTIGVKCLLGLICTDGVTTSVPNIGNLIAVSFILLAIILFVRHKKK